MRLSRWMLVIGIVVGFGCLKVAQRNAILVKSYALGERMDHLHAKRNEVAWLHAQVTGLSSPTHLAKIAEERRLELVAWSWLPPQVSRSSPRNLAAGAPEREDGPSNE